MKPTEGHGSRRPWTQTRSHLCEVPHQQFIQLTTSILYDNISYQYQHQYQYIHILIYIYIYIYILIYIYYIIYIYPKNVKTDCIWLSATVTHRSSCWHRPSPMWTLVSQWVAAPGACEVRGQCRVSFFPSKVDWLKEDVPKILSPFKSQNPSSKVPAFIQWHHAYDKTTQVGAVPSAPLPCSPAMRSCSWQPG